ncbi:hypothetical protein JGU66_31175 [Myxococcaceae bacterium JPH2]|nr:hypothetical protein [Myxococcaceae bacterium JPH2]
MGASLQNAWAVLKPHLALVLAGLGVLLAAGAGVFLWWRKRSSAGVSPSGGQRPLASGQLMRLRARFLKALPWRYRASVRDFPTVVVLGPAGSGKSRLIDVEVDWKRQANQFLPSLTEDPLLQMYLGPDVVVHEVSAPVLEDGSRNARRALRKLWKASFGRQHLGRVVVVLDVRWLADTSPDEVRRVTQLLRGKINLLAEVCQASVDTRLCLTHMDTLEGFSDFAKLLRQNGVPLELEVPPAGQEEQLGNSLRPLEKYLALGLTSLAPDAFERLASFFSRGSESFAVLGRFVATLVEGGSLAYPLKLSRVHLSALATEDRAPGALSVRMDQKPQQLFARYRWMHLRRCALILAVCCLPVLAAYAHFYQLLLQAQQKLVTFQSTVQRLEERHQSVSGSVVEGQTQDAMKAMEDLWGATRYWPPLASSFTDEWADLRSQLAQSIRLSYLKPQLEWCQEQCRRCGARIPGCHPVPVLGRTTRAQPLAPARPAPGDDETCHREDFCRPEEVLYTLGVLYASRNDDLGHFVLEGLRDPQKRQLGWTSEALGLHLSSGTVGNTEKNWVDAVGLAGPMIADYVIASDTPFDQDVPWATWPFAWLSSEGLLGPWREHFQQLHTLLEARDFDLAAWKELREERVVLREQLTQSAPFGSARRVLDLLNASSVKLDSRRLKGVESMLGALDWMRSNQAVLEAVLRMEDEADVALRAAEQMTPAQLLTRADGLFAPADGDALYRVEVLQRDFEFSPMDVSRQLLDKLIRKLKETGRSPFDTSVSTPRTGSTVSAVATEGEGDDDVEFASGQAPVVGRVLGRSDFESQISPLVDEFTERLAKSKLSREEAVERASFVRGKVEDFARRYGQDLFASYRGYRFHTSRATLSADLAVLLQPSSNLEAMLRDVSGRASIGPLEGDYYAAMRDAVAPFKPVVQLMTPDKNGNLAELAAYTTLISQLQMELNGVKAATAKPAPAKDAAAPAPNPTGVQLSELLSPTGRVALAMLLEEDDSYLRRVDAWLDQHGLVGEFRQPFRQPFLVVRSRGRAELERVIAEQWAWQGRRVLEPLVKRYPFNANAQQEVDPSELEILRRKDGTFWQFVTQVLSPLLEERGSEWTLRFPLKTRLQLPARMLTTLSQVGHLSRLLWDDEGNAKPIQMQVRPLPLPPSPAPDNFVTMSFLKCGGAAAFGFNQRPTWADFPLSWVSPQPASIGVELRTPARDGKRYRSMEMSHSSWNCFRLLESATLTEQQNVVWVLPGRGSALAEKVLELSFGLRGEPWAPFRGMTP